MRSEAQNTWRQMISTNIE